MIWGDTARPPGTARARQWGTTLVTVALIAFLSLAHGGTASAASSPPAAPAQLGLVAVGQKLGYFAVTMSPGTTKQLHVQLINQGSAPATARTYKADAFTLAGGGFGVQPSSVVPSGASAWVDYPTAVTTLAAQERVAETFSVTVPVGTAPGEYLSAVAAESGAITPADIAAGATQIVRTALAVSIRVPGALHPSVSIGDVGQPVAAGKTTMTIQLSNTGNQRLTPTVHISLAAAGGDGRVTRKVTMGSFYAGTTSSVQVPLPKGLPAGRYTATITLTDTAAGFRPVTRTVQVTVSRDAASIAVAASGGFPWPWGIAVVLAALVIGAGGFYAARWRARA